MESAIDAGAAAPATDAVLTETTTTETAVAAPSLDDTLAAVYDKISKAPDRSKATGQFLPKSGEAEGEATTDTPEVAATGAQPEKSADQPKDTKLETVTSIEPPMSWSAEMKAKWSALPPELQPYLVQRDKETHEAITRIGQEKKSVEDRIKSYEPLDQLIEARKDEFNRRGVTPAQAFNVLMDAQKRLDENPVTGLVQIAQTYGLGPQALIDNIIHIYSGQQQPNTATPSVPPEVARMLAEVPQLKASITEMQRQKQEDQKSARDKAEATLTSQIAEFSKDKPHFQAVEDDVTALIPAIRAKHPNAAPIELLAKAYDAATWANPEVRERILADQRKAEEDKRRDEQVKKAKDASKSAAVNVKSGTAGKSNPKSWIDTVESEAARLYG